jgi:hypothetical protein
MRGNRGPRPVSADAPPAAPGGAGAASPCPEASDQARRLAAAILEVLAGARTTGDAARALGLSLARYYQIEARALAGLVSACEDRRRGRRGGPGGELAALRRECEQLRRECSRQQALARATRRTAGLTPAPAPAAAEGGPRRRARRPTARALKMAALLRPGEESPAPAPAPAPPSPAPP